MYNKTCVLCFSKRNNPKKWRIHSILFDEPLPTEEIIYVNLLTRTTPPLLLVLPLPLPSSVFSPVPHHILPAFVWRLMERISHLGLYVMRWNFRLLLTLIKEYRSNYEPGCRFRKLRFVFGASEITSERGCCRLPDMYWKIDRQTKRQTDIQMNYKGDIHMNR